MCRHLPWRKRITLSTQRVKWPSTIAIQMSAALQRPHRLDERAQADRNRDLRGESDVERAARVAGALQAAGVDERHGDEEAGQREVLQQLFADASPHRPVAPKMPEQRMRKRDEHQADDRGDGDADARGGVHALNRALRVTGAEVLPGDGGCRAHQADRRPRDHREELGVADGVGRLRGRAVLERADEAQQHDARRRSSQCPARRSAGRN